MAQASVLPAPPRFYATGVTVFDPAQTEAGNVLFTAADGHAYLIDVDGQVVHAWAPPTRDESVSHARALDNGHLLTNLQNTRDPTYRRLAELDAESRVVWEYRPPEEGMRLHHDHRRLANGHTLLICRRPIDDPEISRVTLQDECILEVDAQGAIVWDWQLSDHFDELALPQEVRDLIFENGGSWAHANSLSIISDDTSHKDPRLRPGNLIVSFRFLDMVAIIDRDTAEVVWSIRGLTIGQHDAEMLPDALDGGGNILIFDNGFGGRYEGPAPLAHSRVIEVDPVDLSIDYEYTAADSGDPDWFFDSWFISAADRLANGNTFITEGAFGRIFEVNPAGSIVWEYVSPYSAPGSVRSNRVYRAYKLPTSWTPAP